METSAPKRRKTSPSTALPVDPRGATTTPPPPPSDNPTRDKEARPSRASYAWPTKASLSRHNPDILQRRLSSPTKSRGTEDDARNAQHTDARPQAQQDGLAPQLDRQMRSDVERATSRHRRPDVHPSRSPTRQLGGNLSARPRRTPVKPNPRPLPPPGPDDDEDDILNPFAGRVLRRSPLAGLPEPTVEEPELPPTPVHVDNVASTPPTGIHSTPTHRPRRSRALAERIRSSPTKQRPAKPAGENHRQGGEHILPTTEIEKPSATVTPPILSTAGNVTVKARPRPETSNIRGVKHADPDSEKKREYNALKAEVAQLEQDLAVVAEENYRIRLELSGEAVLLPKETSSVFDVLRRHLSTVPKKPDDAANPTDDPWLQAALDPIAFLPFGKPSGALPTLFPEEVSVVEPEKEPVSHHPIVLDARAALPFLQAFTPLALTSHVTMLPSGDSDTRNQDGTRTDNALLQHHSMTVRSDSAPGLFTARVDFTVNTTTHAITSLSVPSVSPPCAAAELLPLTAQILAEPEVSCSALSRNVVVLTTAMGSWLRVAIRRAKAWRTLDRNVGTPEAQERTTARVRAAKSGRKLGRKGHGGADGDVDENAEQDADSDGVADLVDSLVGVDELLPFMGFPWMDFPILTTFLEGNTSNAAKTDDAVLRVQWRIEFDWTGEATSHLQAQVRLPARWHHADERKTLSGISGLFDNLVRRGVGVVPAVETVVTLLAGSKGS